MKFDPSVFNVIYLHVANCYPRNLGFMRVIHVLYAQFEIYPPNLQYIRLPSRHRQHAHK